MHLRNQVLIFELFKTDEDWGSIIKVEKDVYLIKESSNRVKH